MKNRLSRKILEVKLNNLCRLLGKKIGINKGEWSLDYNSIHGGYIVVEFMENGGEFHPLLNCRLPAKQMALVLDCAIAVSLKVDETVVFLKNEKEKA